MTGALLLLVALVAIAWRIRPRKHVGRKAVGPTYLRERRRKFDWLRHDEPFGE